MNPRLLDILVCPLCKGPLLYRKVNDGILASIEKNRSRDLSGRGAVTP